MKVDHLVCRVDQRCRLQTLFSGNLRHSAQLPSHLRRRGEVPVRRYPRPEGKEAPSRASVAACGTGEDRAIPSPRAGAGLLRRDSGSDFLGCLSGMRVKVLWVGRTSESLVDGRYRPEAAIQSSTDQTKARLASHAGLFCVRGTGTMDFGESFGGFRCLVVSIGRMKSWRS